MEKECEGTACGDHRGEVVTVMVNSGLRHWEQRNYCEYARYIEMDNGFRTVKIEDFVKYIEQQFAAKATLDFDKRERKHYELAGLAPSDYQKQYHENIAYAYGRGGHLLLQLADIKLDPIGGGWGMVSHSPDQ